MTDLHQRLLHQLDRVKALNTSPPDVSRSHQPSRPHPSRAPGADDGQLHIPALNTEAGVDQQTAAETQHDHDEQSPDESRNGLIIYPGDEPGVPCEVSDLTAAGARLHLADDITVPSCFQFTILPDSAVKQAQVCWRGDRELGIRFINTD